MYIKLPMHIKRYIGNFMDMSKSFSLSSPPHPHTVLLYGKKGFCCKIETGKGMVHIKIIVCIFNV